MIHLIGLLEPGWNHKLEIRAWKQIKGAYGTQLCLVPRDCGSMERALEALSPDTSIVLVIPPGRTERSIELQNYVQPEGDVAYVFGCAGNNLTTYLDQAHSVVHITTPKDTDMFAVSVVPMVIAHGTQSRAQAQETQET